MIAIIVAAGSGKRLQINKPKGLLNIGNQPLIKYSIDSLIKCKDIKSILIVTGFAAEKYTAYVKTLDTAKPIHLIYNDKYAESGSLYSLSLALKYIYSKTQNEDILILDSDIIYDFDDFNHFVENPEKNSIMTTNVPEGRYDACYVAVNADGSLDKISKNIHYIRPFADNYWEHIGIVKSSKETVKEILDYTESIVKSTNSLHHEYDYAFENIPTEYQIVNYDNYLWSEVDDNTQLTYMINHIYPKLNLF